jgi:hypothetical protein
VISVDTLTAAAPEVDEADLVQDLRLRNQVGFTIRQAGC